MKDITLKEVVEYYFDRHIPLPYIYCNTDDKKMHNRTIESYDPTTGDFKLSRCKITFSLSKPTDENSNDGKERFFGIDIESRDAGWADLVCRHIWGQTFEKIQNAIDHLAQHDEENTCVSEMGGSWMKYTGSHPRYIKTSIMGVPVEAIKTYATVTNIKAGSYYCGETYSNTSTRWAYEANMTNHYVYFHSTDTEND